MRPRHRKGVTTFFLPALLCLAAPSRGGEDLEFLPPAGCLPGDGGPPFHVYVYVPGTGTEKGALFLHTSTGWLEEPEDQGAGLFKTYFQPPQITASAEVTWSGEWKTGQKTLRGVYKGKLCPNPTGLVEVRAEPDRLLAEKDRQATISVRVVDEDGRPLPELPLELTTNVGKLGALQEVGNGNYRVTFEAPEERYPQVALITVANPIGTRLDRVAAARAVIPIAARLELPGRTAPRVQMEMVIANRTFGPVTADSKGDFRLPILVPPGYGQGKATSVDRMGNRESRTVNLFLPETNQLGLWAYPRELPADGASRSRLLVTTIDPFGFATDIGKLKIVAGTGSVGGTKRIAQGLYEAYYTAPAAVGKGHDSLEVTFPEGGKKSRAVVEIRLRPGPAAEATLHAPEFLAADAVSIGLVAVEVRDNRKNAISNELVSLTSSLSGAKLSEFRETAAGHYEASLVVDPDPERMLLDLQGEVRDRGGTIPSRLVVAAESHQLAPGGDFLEAVLIDPDGLPVEDQSVQLTFCGPTQNEKTNIFGRARFQLPQPGAGWSLRCVLEAKKGKIRKTVIFAPNGEHLRLVPLELDPFLPPNKAIGLKAEVQLTPPTEVIPELEVVPPSRKGAPWLLRAKLTDSSEKPAAGRNVEFASSIGTVGRTVREVKPGIYETELLPPPTGWRAIEVSATDVATGASARREVSPPGEKP